MQLKSNYYEKIITEIDIPDSAEPNNIILNNRNGTANVDTFTSEISKHIIYFKGY